MLPRLVVVWTLTVAICAAGPARADEIRVAVASNFTHAMRALAERFEAISDHEITLIFGSTGKHYAQIRNGAPFDVYFAADADRPRMLEEDGLIVPGSRVTYALGRLVLWSPRENYVDPAGDCLEAGDFRHLAIANPKLAPYGQAAAQVLQARGLWEKMQGQLVRGENIGQAYQFVKSGNAQLGFVACSQVTRPGQPTEGSFWEVPQELYEPIVQQAVLLRDLDAGRELLAFVRGAMGAEILVAFGYTTP